MAITYNNLYMDIRQELHRAGIDAATLEARELVKGRVLEAALLGAREALEALCAHENLIVAGHARWAAERLHEKSNIWV